MYRRGNGWDTAICSAWCTLIHCRRIASKKNVPPYIKAAREPLAYIGVNSIGLRRRGFLQDRIQRIEDIYRTLYVQNANMSQALKVADVEFPACEDKDLVLDFIRESDKGIIEEARSNDRCKLEGSWKKFGLRWVFKNLSGTISPGEHVLIKGSNGSGKSTFGKLLVAASDPTSGSFQWEQNGTDISADELPQEIAWSSPFMEIPENITVSEALEFHSTFRAPWDDTKLTDLAKSSESR